MKHIVMPARKGSRRLPGKMLADIGGQILVLRSLARVERAAWDTNVFLATDSREIADKIGIGAVPILTSPDCRSGTDRCAEVAEMLGWPDDDIVVDVQADMPFLDPADLRRFLAAVDAGSDWDVLTGSCDVFVVTTGFERKTIHCHVGIYAYRVDTLRRIAALPTSPNEEAERLEQCRARDAGMRFAFHEFRSMPFEVNTANDLEAARSLVEALR